MRCVFNFFFYYVFEIFFFSWIILMLRWDRICIKLISVGNRIKWLFGVNLVRVVIYVVVCDKFRFYMVNCLVIGL